MDLHQLDSQKLNFGKLEFRVHRWVFTKCHLIYVQNIFSEMGWFKKLKNDIKFAAAGKGHKAANHTQPPPPPSNQSSNRQNSTKLPPPSKPTTQHAAHAQNHARLAALNRQESRDARNAPVNKTKDSVRRQAAAELANERAEMEQEMAAQSSISLPTPVSERPVHMNTNLAANGVYFVCPLTDEKIQRHQFDNHLSTLLDQFLAQSQGSVGSPDSEDRSVLLNLIFTLNDSNLEKYQTCIKTFTSYLSNVVKNPGEEKFRKIRRGNKAFQSRIVTLRGAEKLLNVIGFNMTNLDGDDFLIFTDENTEILQSWLDSFLKDPCSIVFELDRGERLFYPNPNSARKPIELPVDFYNLSKTELQSLYGNQKEKSQLSQTLLTQEMRDRLATKHAKKFKYCVIRIKFPDELILQGTFRPHESGVHVKNFVRTYLADHVKDILSFNLKAAGEAGFLEDSCSLERYTPSAVFNLIVDGEFLKDIREQTGKFHLVSDAIMLNLEDL